MVVFFFVLWKILVTNEKNIDLNLVSSEDL